MGIEDLLAAVREEILRIAARHGAPLAVGYGTTEMYLGSDAMALSPFTSRLTSIFAASAPAFSARTATVARDTPFGSRRNAAKYSQRPAASAGAHNSD